jgi:hypothetical protein
MATITITWAAFSSNPDKPRPVTRTSFDLNLPMGTDDYVVLDAIYEATNLQDELAMFGKPTWLWEKIKAVLPADRTHTSLSVNDAIKIDGRAYLITDTGFIMIYETQEVGA